MGNISGKFLAVTFPFLGFTYDFLQLLTQRRELLKISPSNYTKAPQFLTGSMKVQD